MQHKIEQLKKQLPENLNEIIFDKDLDRGALIEILKKTTLTKEEWICFKAEKIAKNELYSYHVFAVKPLLCVKDEEIVAVRFIHDDSNCIDRLKVTEDIDYDWLVTAHIFNGEIMYSGYVKNYHDAEFDVKTIISVSGERSEAPSGMKGFDWRTFNEVDDKIIVQQHLASDIK